MIDRDQLRTWTTKIAHQARAIFRHANKLSGGVLGIIRDAIEGFTQARGSEAAASMAYYTLFSLFPLLLAFVAGGSYLLDRQQVFQQVVDLISNAFPISQNLIEENLMQVLRLRGAVGLIGLAVAIWSASGVFAILTRNINRAWTDAAPRGFLGSRLVALGMVATLAVLLVISLLLSTALNVASRSQLPLVDLQSLYGTPIWTAFSDVIPWLFIFFLFLALYRWVPNEEVPWRAAFSAALVVALAWEIAANAFAWYVSSGLAKYQIVYGSLGTVVALMFWIYLSSWIILFGAHLGAAVARHRKRNEPQE
jgi:membrane protein